MKKVLFITPRVPFPAISGGLISTLDSLKFLARNFDLDFISFIEKKNSNIEQTKNKLKDFGVKESFFIDYKIKNRSIWNILNAILLNMPLSIYRNKSIEMKNKVGRIADNYDCIFVDHWLSFQYIPKNYKGTVILKEHNAEYKMWERLFYNEKNLIKKLFLKFETARIKKYEAMICNSVTKVITVTEEDKQNLIEIGAKGDNIKMLPAVILDIKQEIIKDFSNRENALLYVGSLSWESNIDGLKYFLENIYPKIKKKMPEIKFYIIGKNPPNILQNFAQNDTSIILTGFVDDLTEYYNKCKLFVVYLRYGSGIKIKILEALSNSMPVITNDIGMEGIFTKGAVLANEDNDFVNKIEFLLKNNETLSNMSIAGLKYIIKNYSEKAYIDYFEEFKEL